MILNKKSRFINKLLKTISKNNEVISVTHVGSYKHNSIEEISDIDIVVIVNKLTKTIYKDILKEAKSIKISKFYPDYKIKLNTTFGPLKMSTKNSIVIHLMIYSYDQHIIHTLESPFTTYDWEYSKEYRKNSLREVKRTYKISFNDFNNGYRSSKGYLDNINKKQISYKEYKFYKNEIALEERKKNINKIYQIEFSYHIYKNLLGNYLKFLKNTIRVNDIILVWQETLPEMFKKHIGDYKILEKNKKDKIYKYGYNLEKTIKFLNDFEYTLNQFDKESIDLSFVRHLETEQNKEDVFFGTYLNSPILLDNNLKSNEFLNVNVEEVYCSDSERTKMTANLYNFDDIKITKQLNEVDYGKADGMNVQLFKKRYSNIVLFWRLGFDKRFPHGENNKDVLDRINSLVSVAQKNTIYFTHQVPIRVLLGNFYNIRQKDWYKIQVPHNTLIKFKKYKGNLYSNIDRNLIETIFKNL